MNQWRRRLASAEEKRGLEQAASLGDERLDTDASAKLTMPEFETSSWRPRRAAVIGIGLLGGSVGLALRRFFPGVAVVGCARRPETLDAALRSGAATEVTEDAHAACEGADLVIVGTPVTSIAEHAIAAAADCDDDAIITDVGSTKAQIVRQVAEDARAAGKFIGSHPIAGGEKSGPQHARSDLFLDRRVVLTPTTETRQCQIERATVLWQSFGAEVVQMHPEEHDDFLAATSHLPHLVAAALVSIIPSGALPLVGTGWRDSTRIAAGCPELWTAICRENAAAIRAQLKRMNRSLEEIATAVGDGDFAAVERLLQQASELRRRVDQTSHKRSPP